HLLVARSRGLSARARTGCKNEPGLPTEQDPGIGGGPAAFSRFEAPLGLPIRPQRSRLPPMPTTTGHDVRPQDPRAMWPASASSRATVDRFPIEPPRPGRGKDGSIPSAAAPEEPSDVRRAGLRHHEWPGLWLLPIPAPHID